MITSMPRRFILCGGGCAGLTALGGCLSNNPATGGYIMTGFSSLEDDMAIGAETHPQILEQFGGVYDGSDGGRLNSYVERIGNKLAQYAEIKEFNYTFTVVDSPIVNAFALPGGYIYLSRGFLALASSEAEMASVLGHEIGHATARHGIRQQAQAQLTGIGATLAGVAIAAATGISNTGGLLNFGANAFIKSYSRAQELEADELGIRYMSRAGYDPHTSATLLDSLGEHSRLEARRNGLPEGTVDSFDIMSTHPRSKERVAQANKLAVEAKTKLTRTGSAPERVGREDYLRAIDGMVFGSSRAQGFLHRGEFVHPDLGFRLTRPEHAILRNFPDRVILDVPKDKKAIVFDMDTKSGGVELKRYMRNTWLEGASLSNLQDATINGMDAATATLGLRTQGGAMGALAVVVDFNSFYGRAIARFLCLAPQARFSKALPGFMDTVNTFKTLTPDEADGLYPPRIAIVNVDANDSLASLASGYPYAAYREDAFRLFNDLEPGDPLPKGTAVKTLL